MEGSRFVLCTKMIIYNHHLRGEAVPNLCLKLHRYLGVYVCWHYLYQCRMSSAALSKTIVMNRREARLCGIHRRLFLTLFGHCSDAGSALRAFAAIMQVYSDLFFEKDRMDRSLHQAINVPVHWHSDGTVTPVPRSTVEGVLRVTEIHISGPGSMRDWNIGNASTHDLLERCRPAVERERSA